MNKMAEKKDDNIVYIGQKPFMNYLTAVNTQINKTGSCILKSRGKFTARAIDIALAAQRMAKPQFEYEIKDIKVATEVLHQEAKDGKQARDVNVSTIDITITKK